MCRMCIRLRGRRESRDCARGVTTVWIVIQNSQVAKNWDRISLHLTRCGLTLRHGQASANRGSRPSSPRDPARQPAGADLL